MRAFMVIVLSISVYREAIMLDRPTPEMHKTTLSIIKAGTFIYIISPFP